MKRGYIYTAFGEKYLKEATDSALSLKSCSPSYPIALVTNDQNFNHSVFDEIIVEKIPFDRYTEKIGFLSKIYFLSKSPYDYTLFVDTDTYHCDNSDELFELLDFFDLLISHDYNESSFATLNDYNLSGYRTYNTGVIGYRSNPAVKKFLEKWLSCFILKLKEYWSDQPAFMEALLSSDIKTYSLQTIYNFRFNQFKTISNGYVKVLHGRSDDFQSIASILNQSNEHRSWDPVAWKCRSWSKINLLISIKLKVKKLITLCKNALKRILH